MTESTIWALTVVELIGTSLLAFANGDFTKSGVICFIIGNIAWQFFILSSLFKYVKKKPKPRISI